MDHRTTMRTNNYRNYIAKLDISQKAFDGMLAVDLGMFGSLQRNNYLPFLQKLLYSAATFNPTFPDGPNADGTYPGVPEAMWITNPVAMLQMKQDEDNAHFNVHLNALLTLAPNLKLRAFGSYSYNTVNNSHYYPTFVWSHGEAYRGNDKTQEMLGNVSLDYTLNTGPSSLNVMVLAEAQERKVTGFHTTVTNFSRDDLPYGHSAFRGSNYGHVTTSVADFVLAKLALNAEIYADDDWTDQQHLDGSTLKFQVGDDIVNAWEAAIHYCDRFNAEGFQLADEYADNFTVYNESSPENIWVIPMDRDLYKTQQQNMFRSYHYRHAAAYGFGGENGSCATLTALRTFGYETDDEDYRFHRNYWAGQVLGLDDEPIRDRSGDTLTYYPWKVEMVLNGSPYVETAGARMKKYEIDRHAGKDGKLMDNDIVLFRYADVLLMRAEAHLRNGHPELGQPDFDAVRRRAYMPTRPLTLQNIYDERLLELCWEGWRRQDMIRFRRYQSLFQGDGFDEKVNEDDGHTTVFPIPSSAMELNPFLEQNPGY